MYHFFDAITNDRGDALKGYLVRAVDTATGDPVDLYADASLTPIVSVSGIANMAKVDTNGNASFYVADGNYHLDIYAPDGTTFQNRAPDLPMRGPNPATGSGPQRLSYGARARVRTVRKAADAADAIHTQLVGYAALAGTTGGYGLTKYLVQDESTDPDILNSWGWAVAQATAAGGIIYFHPRGHFNIKLSANQYIAFNNVTIIAPGRNVTFWCDPLAAGFVYKSVNCITAYIEFRTMAGVLSSGIGADGTKTEHKLVNVVPDLCDKIAFVGCDFRQASDGALDASSSTYNASGTPCRMTVQDCIFWDTDQPMLVGANENTVTLNDPVLLSITLYRPIFAGCGERQPKVIGRTFVDVIDPYVIMLPWQRDNFAPTNEFSVCYGVECTSGGKARVRGGLMTACVGTGYNATQVATVNGISGNIDVVDLAVENGLVINTANTANVPTPAYTIAHTVVGTGANREEWIAGRWLAAGAKPDAAPEGQFSWTADETAYPNFETIVPDREVGGRWLRIDCQPEAVVMGDIIPTRSVTTRSGLAKADVSDPIYLTESGREGTFVWSSSDLSGIVTIDTRQGIYVAPSSDTTGASGAWVRKWSGPINVKWFGAIADNSTNAIPAINGAMLVAEALGVSVDFGLGTLPIYIPCGLYYCATSIIPQQTTQILGDGGKGDAGGAATVLRFPAGVHGIDLQEAVGVRAPSIRLKGLSLSGGYTSGNEGEYHGLNTTVRFVAEDVIVNSFQGDGFHIVASSDVSNSFLQNANCWSLINCSANSCRNGLYAQGNDANAGYALGFNANYNRAWGICDKSALGNTYVAPQCESNGLIDSSSPHAVVYNNGFWFTPQPGQATAASTTAPPTTLTDTSVWAYIQAGGINPSTPQWFSGIGVREGGGIYLGNNGSQVSGATYVEGGQGPTQIGAASMMVGVQHGGTRVITTGGGSYIRNANNVTTVEGIESTGPAYLNQGFVLGLTSSSTTNTTSSINGLTSSQISFNSYSGGASADGYIYVDRSFGFYLNSTVGIKFRVNGVDLGAVDANGLGIAVGTMGYRAGVGGTVTQATSKATGVTLNKSCGQVTMNGAALAAAAKVSFVVTNSNVAATDTIIVSVASGGTANAYRAAVTAVGAGTFTVTVENITAGSLSEAPVINFSILKAVAA